MLQFYYNPISANARRVWIALLEKQIPFEPVLVKLDGDHLTEAFSAINPLQRVPAIMDNGFRVVESLAILDYLESQYPLPALMPMDPQQIATVRMVEMTAVNELQPATLPLTKVLVGLDEKPQTVETARQRVTLVLQFYENLLGDGDYFAGANLTLADIVAGTLVPSVAMFGFSLGEYPRLAAWNERLAQRPSWQETAPQPAAIDEALPNIKQVLERRF